MSETQFQDEQPNVERLNYLSSNFEDAYPSLGEHGSQGNSSEYQKAKESHK